MKRLFILLVLLVGGVVALGFYRGWFDVKYEKAPDGKGQVTATVDNDKIEADKKRAAEKVQGLGGGSKTNAGTPAGKE
jgi:hypothetical protein